MKIRYLTLLFLFLLSPVIAGWTHFQQTRTIRVGIYENSPKIFTDTRGKASGFWPDLVRAIAEDEGWQLIWVHCGWEECTRMLENNEIDLLPDMGWTAERSQSFDFNQETVLVSWARLYVPVNSQVETILDLDGRSIAGMSGSLNFDGPEGIKELAQRFHIQPVFIEKENYTQVFEALERGEADAGITNRDFGNLNEGRYNVARTSIIIQPIELRFAMPKHGSQSAYLIERIDETLRRYKRTPDSPYHLALERYIADHPYEQVVEIIPPWVTPLILVGTGILLFLVAVNLSARAQVQRQTAAIKASEARTRALLDSIPDLIIRLNSEGKFLDYRSMDDNILSIPPREFLGKEMEEVLPTDLARDSMVHVRNAIANKEVQVQEYQMISGGRVRHFEARYSASGEDEVIAIIRDITEQTQAQEALKKSEERFQTIARISPVGIFRTDPEGATYYVNPTWCAITGLDAGEAMGDHWLKAVHPDDRGHLWKNWEETARRHNPAHADYRFVHPDGKIVWVIGQAVPEVNGDGKVVGYVGTITDITARKEAEAVMERSIAAERAALALTKTIQEANLALSRSLDLDEVLQILLAHLSKIVPFDSAGVLLLEEDGELRVCALRRSEAIPEIPLSQTLRFDAAHNPHVLRLIQDRQAVLVSDTRTHDGWISPTAVAPCLSWIGVPLIASGDILGLLSLDKADAGHFSLEHRDLAITLSTQAAAAIQNARLLNELQLYAAELEQRVADRTVELEQRVSEVESLNSAMIDLMEEMKTALKRAESADRLKSAFLATMSHELRTPLNSIIGFTGILLQKLVGPLTPEQEKQMGMVQSSARHLLELINDVLDISKIEADQVELSIDQFELGASVRKSLEKILPMADRKGLLVRTQIEPETIDMTSDRRRVEQILLNLLNNAVKFTERGSITLTCRKEHNTVVIAVKDTGIGIKPDDLALLFQPFRQIDTGITRQFEGTGLGLSICKRLAGLLGGKIAVESEPEKGSTFILTLPLSRE